MLLNAMRKADGSYRTYDEMKAEKIPLKYSGKWIASMCTPCDANGQGAPFAVYMYGVFMAEVTVDTQTGKTQVDKYTVMADVGKINNRLAVDGQIYGGVAQGIGLALSEDFEDLKKHTSLAACGIPYINDIPDAIRNPLHREPAGTRALRRGRRRRGAADLIPRGGHQRHQKRHRGAHHPSAGPAGEGVGRVEVHVEKGKVIAAAPRSLTRNLNSKQSGEPREASRVRRGIWMLSMDQEELRALEQRCIQEEAPECTAACPIHVDGRAFVGHVAKGEWPEAWKVLRKTMPFPGILGRICEAPCRRHCKRREAGDPIQIGDLERACVATPPPPARVQPLPRKGKTIAVIGSGLSGLTAAWDLACKGYSICIFEPGLRLGSPLRDVPGNRLQEAVLEEELERLGALDVAVHLNVDVEPAPFLEQCISENDSVFLSLENVAGRSWTIGRDDAGRIIVDPMRQSTHRPGVYAGGRPGMAEPSPVWQAAEGRWAATSIDRFLQKVSLTAGREKEGPYRTRLFTSLDGVLPLPKVAAAEPDTGYSAEEAVAEARRCLQCECLECVKICAYLERFGAYPRRYAREIYNNESIVMGMRQANKLVNSCSLCGLCERVCPRTSPCRTFACRLGAAWSAGQDAALRPRVRASGHAFQPERAFSPGAPGARADGQHPCLFPGLPAGASTPTQVQRVYAHLMDVYPGGVALTLGCCGAPAFWAGREDEFRSVCDGFLEDWNALGQPELILACSTCFRMFAEHLPQVPVVSLWQALDATTCRQQPQGRQGKNWRFTTRAPHGPTRPSRRRSAGS